MSNKLNSKSQIKAASTPAPSKTIKTNLEQMTEDRDLYQAWWHQECAQSRRLQDEVARLKGVIETIGQVATTFVKSTRDRDDEIPF